MRSVLFLVVAISVFQSTSTSLPKLEGVPVKLAWSKDDSQLYLATAATTARDAALVAQYLIALPSGEPAAVDRPPAWVNEYWGWKSDRTSRHWSDLTIEYKVTKENLQNSPTMTRDAVANGTTASGAGAGVVAATA